MTALRPGQSPPPVSTPIRMARDPTGPRLRRPGLTFSVVGRCGADSIVGRSGVAASPCRSSSPSASAVPAAGPASAPSPPSPTPTSPTGPTGSRCSATAPAREETLDALTAADERPRPRQAGIVDARGGAATVHRRRLPRLGRRPGRRRLRRSRATSSSAADVVEAMETRLDRYDRDATRPAPAAARRPGRRRRRRRRPARPAERGGVRRHAGGGGYGGAATSTSTCASTTTPRRCPSWPGCSTCTTLLRQARPGGRAAPRRRAGRRGRATALAALGRRPDSRRWTTGPASRTSRSACSPARIDPLVLEQLRAQVAG